MKTVRKSETNRLRLKIVNWRCSARLFSFIGATMGFRGTRGLRDITGTRGE